VNTPAHTPASVRAHPAPDRQYYFGSVDYVAALVRVHERRLKFDNFKPVKHRKKILLSAQ